MEINIDFETYSTTDLTAVGVYKYVEDENTGIWCMAYAIGEGEVKLWVPGPKGVKEPLPAEVLAALEDGALLRAWNAQFERVVWNTVGVERYGFPLLPNERFICTQADALAMGLPSSLDRAAKALRLKTEKDMAGNRLAKLMCRPRKPGNPPVWWDTDSAKLARLYAYCEQDVRVEREVQKFTRRLSAQERAVYLLDQRINDRGLRLDVGLATRGKALAYEGVARANQQVYLLTNGDVEAVTQVARLQHWLREQGCDIPDLKASTLQRYLNSNTPQPEHVRNVLLARAEAGKASISKIDKMLDVLTTDGRMHGLLQYHGAGTGRWAGRLVQPQNFPRGTVSAPEQYLSAVLANWPYDALDLMENPVDIVLSLLRAMIIPASGHVLMAADFSAIEARVLAWLAGQSDLVQMFAEGVDVYESTAKEFGTTRQVGKAVILGAGYGMGHQKFLRMALDNYGVDLTLAQSKDFIERYRNRYNHIPLFWRDLEDAARIAVQSEDVVVEVNKDTTRVLRFVRRGEQLWLILPSKRPLCYMYPRIVQRETPWGTVRPTVEVSTVDSMTKRWVRRDLYGGLLAENVVQAVARDLMVHSMLQVEEAGYPVVLTVHDEVVVEPRADVGSFNEFNALISSKPSWAAGCPVTSGGWVGSRYRKG